VTEIDVIAPDGTGRRAVGVDSDETSDSAPSWAPDSRGLAFVRERDWEDAGDAHIWTMAPAHRLTRTPPPLTPVVLRSRVGKRLATFEPGGVVAQVAVTAQVAAAVVREGTRWQVQIFAPIRRVVTLDRRPSSFTASGATLLLNDRRSIFAVDARTGRRRLVARAATAPLGLSLVGRRVAWAENLRRGARIRTVELR
jgi:hypothetical protein